MGDGYLLIDSAALFRDQTELASPIISPGVKQSFNSNS